MNKKSITKRKLIIYGILGLILIALFPYRGIRFASNPEVQEGDVIFHMSTSDQSPLIAIATGSPLTHCGIVVMKSGQPYVLEASSTLKTTPLNEFIKRGKCGAYWVKRPKSGVVGSNIRYGHLLGRRYDLAFSFNNRNYYCSELVYDIYKYQLGTELCEPRPMKSYFTLGMKKVMRRRGMDPNGLVVAPSDIFFSDELRYI